MPVEPDVGRRVLMLSYEFPPLGGGTGVAMRNLLDGFAPDPSLRVDVVTSRAGKSVETERLTERIRVFKLPIPKRGLHYWRPQELALWIVRARRFIRNLARPESYDLCHCWSGWPSALVGSRMPRPVPCVISLRGSDVPGYNPRLRWLELVALRPVSRRLWRRAAAVVAVSGHLRSLALRVTPELDIGVILNGVNTRRFKPGDAPGPVVLFVGRLIPRKGARVLLDAFRGLARDHPEVRLVLVGDGPEREALQATSASYGLGDRVEFLGYVNRDRLAGLYREASLFVSPALEEAMPNVVLEAMASGLPVVATRAGADEIVRDNGTLVDPGDVDALGKALRSYLTDAELRSRAGRRSRELAETHSWSAVATSYRELYERVLR